MKEHIEKFLLEAESKAFATFSENGLINVVPVSTVQIKDGEIILINYFMDKTLSNIKVNQNVSLVAWTKMIGYQIKGVAKHETEGQLFLEMKNWVKEILPERVVKGIVKITPTEIYDIAPKKNSDQILSSS